MADNLGIPEGFEIESTPQMGTMSFRDMPEGFELEQPITTDQPLQAAGLDIIPKVPDVSPTLDFAKETISNIPGSAVEFGKAVVTPIIHPIETVKSLKSLATGLFHKLTPGEQPDEKVVDAVANFFAERYGSVDAVKETIKTDPVGVMADLATVLTAGGGIVAKVGPLSKVAQIEKAGKAIGAVGKAIEPTRLVGKVVAPVITGTGTLGKQILGNITTGVGAEAVEQAYKRSPEFVAALKGQIDPAQILDQAKGGLQNIKRARGTQYKQRLEGLKQAKGEVDFSGVTNKFKKLTDEFEIKVRPVQAGEKLDRVSDRFDFSRATVADAKSIDDIKKVIDVVGEWGKQKGDYTVAGMDLLKKRLDDLYSETSNGRAFVTQMKQEVVNSIVKKAPQYKTMTKDYEQMSGVIKEMEQALSLNSKAMADTAIKKLTSTMRENFKFRKELVTELQKFTDDDLLAQIAGVSMQDLTPRGLVGKLAGGATGLNVLFGGLASIDPTIALTLAASSPRAVAEFMRALKLGTKGFKKVKEFVPETAGQSAFQVGRLTEIGGTKEQGEVR